MKLKKVSNIKNKASDLQFYELHPGVYETAVLKKKLLSVSTVQVVSVRIKTSQALSQSQQF